MIKQTVSTYLKCVFCDKIIATKNAHIHMRKLHPESKNNCPICKARQLEIRFNDHILEDHRPELRDKKDFQYCENCKTNFLVNDYVNHAERCSKIKDKFTCIKCNKILKWSDLQMHYRNITCPVPLPNLPTPKDDIPEEPSYTPQIKIIYTPSNGKTDRKKS